MKVARLEQQRMRKALIDAEMELQQSAVASQDRRKALQAYLFTVAADAIAVIEHEANLACLPSRSDCILSHLLLYFLHQDIRCPTCLPTASVCELPKHILSTPWARLNMACCTSRIPAKADCCVFYCRL